ncbi:MAG: PEP-CTERM sorting domain-containing protein, partial [Gammaproteobacteria bacterium]
LRITMKTKIAWIGTLFSVLVLSPLAAQAIPVSYSFTTDTARQIGFPGNPDSTLLEGLLAAFSVSGTFHYDSDGPFLVDLGAGILAGSSVYRAMSNLSGSVGGYSFSDPVGLGIVGDERFNAQNDFLGLHADGNIQNLVGFDLAGFSLTNVRLFWIETLVQSAPDFLEGQSLPGTLPNFGGRLALDFGSGARVFFENLRVQQVPEPGTLALLVVGLLGISVRRRRYSA